MAAGRWIAGLLAAALAGSAAAAEGPGLPALQKPIGDLKPLAVLHIGKTADWVNLAAGSVWVGSTGPNAVNRIDPSTNTVSAVVALPGAPCAGLASGLGHLWVPLCGPKPGLARVDLKTGRLAEVFAVAPAGAEGGVAVSADSVWMVTDKQGSLARIDPVSGKVRQVIATPPGSFNPAYADGRIYLTQVDGAALTTVDARTGKVLATTPTGPHPRFLSAGADAVWTLNQGDGTLTRVDVRRHSAGSPIALGTPGHGGDIAYRDGWVWTTMGNYPLTVTNAKTGVVRRQWIGKGGDSMGVGPKDIWLTDYTGGTITRYAIAEALKD